MFHTGRAAALRGTTVLLLFVASSAEADAQCQTKETPLAGAQDDAFGYSVSMSSPTSTTMAVGAPLVGLDAGAVTVFYQSGGNHWNEIKTITNGVSNDQFGYSVGNQGDLLIAGAPFQGFSNVGAAYLYGRNVTGPDNWGLIKQLSAIGGVGPDQLGFSVDVWGDYAIAGARGQSTGGFNSGAAYVYERDSGGMDNWGEVIRLKASVPGGNDWFGYSVSVSGDRAVVGAPGENSVAVDSGAAYVFERIGGVWTQVAMLKHPSPSFADVFGTSVSIDGDWILVGAPQDDNGVGLDAGSAFLFKRTAGGIWNPGPTLTGTCANAFFGTSVALSEYGYAAVGSPSGCGAGMIATGSAHFFDKDEGGIDNWGLLYEALASDGQYPDAFGYAVAAAGNFAAAGAPGDDNGNGTDAGAVYPHLIYACPYASTFCFCPTGVCGNPDPGAGCANSTGSGSEMFYSGSGSVSADDLVLTVTGLPTNVLGLYFRSQNATFVTLGDGIRCVGSPLVRLPAQSSGPSGTFVEGPGIVAAAPPANPILAGQTWYFQAWHRDNTGPCGSGTNVSSGVSVTFSP